MARMKIEKKPIIGLIIRVAELSAKIFAGPVALALYLKVTLDLFNALKVGIIRSILIPLNPPVPITDPFQWTAFFIAMMMASYCAMRITGITLSNFWKVLKPILKG